MRFVLTFLLAFSVVCVSAQKKQKLVKGKYLIFNPDTVVLRTNDDVRANKELLMNCADYILDNKLRAMSGYYTDCYRVLTEKMQVNVDYRLSYIHPKKLVSAAMNTYRLGVYAACQTKYKLENPQHIRNDSLVTAESIKMFIAYCEDPDKKAPSTPETERVAELIKEGKLGDYILELKLQAALENRDRIRNNPYQ